MILLFRGYHAQKISGKAIYVNYLFRGKKQKNIFHDWNLLNLIHPKVTYLFKSYDLYILYSLKVFLVLLMTKIFRPKITEIVVDSQENLFIVPIVKFFRFKKITAIFYDFSSRDKVPSKTTVSNVLSCTRIIVMTDAMKVELLGRVKGLKVEKIDVLYYKIPRELFCPISREELIDFKQEQKLPAKYILYVGSEQDRKNFFTLVRAFKRLQKKYPDLYLVKIGRDQAKSNRGKLLKMLDSDAMFRERFRLIEDCSDHDLVSFYNLAQLFAFPSSYEGFGIPLVEAMACGIPIIAVDIETTREICADAITYVSEAKDVNQFAKKMDQILSDKYFRREMMKKAYQRAKEFSY